MEATPPVDLTATTPLTRDSAFASVTPARKLETLDLSRKCEEDSDPKKVNLSVGPGAYRDDKGLPWVQPVVRAVEEATSRDRTLHHESFAPSGLKAFIELSVELTLGAASAALVENRAFGVQTLGGVGALRLGADFLRRFHGGGVGIVDDASDCGVDGEAVALVSRPAAEIHRRVLEAAGFKKIRFYRYLNEKTKDADVDAIVEDLELAEDGSIVLLNACCHNPTGSDLELEDWRRIAAVMKAKGHFPFFDASLLGLGSGDADADAAAVRLFADEGLEVFVALSFSANFGLYNERCGCLVVVTSESKVNARVLSQLEALVAPLWSSPANHGARIVATILNNQAYKDEWRRNVRKMADRVVLMRRLLNEKSKELGTPGNWDHVTRQRGFYCHTGLNRRQCRVLVEKHKVYLASNGCANLCGLNSSNVESVARAIFDVASNVVDDPAMPGDDGDDDVGDDENENDIDDNEHRKDGDDDRDESPAPEI